LAPGHFEDAVTKLTGSFEFMGREHNRCATCAHLTYNLIENNAPLCIEARVRLV